jgi:hypothetical protein
LFFVASLRKKVLGRLSVRLHPSSFKLFPASSSTTLLTRQLLLKLFILLLLFLRFPSFVFRIQSFRATPFLECIILDLSEARTRLVSSFDPSYTLPFHGHRASCCSMSTFLGWVLTNAAASPCLSIQLSVYVSKRVWV